MRATEAFGRLGIPPRCLTGPMPPPPQLKRQCPPLPACASADDLFFDSDWVRSCASDSALRAGPRLPRGVTVRAVRTSAHRITYRRPLVTLYPAWRGSPPGTHSVHGAPIMSPAPASETHAQMPDEALPPPWASYPETRAPLFRRGYRARGTCRSRGGSGRSSYAYWKREELGRATQAVHNAATAATRAKMAMRPMPLPAATALTAKMPEVSSQKPAGVTSRGSATTDSVQGIDLRSAGNSWGRPGRGGASFRRDSSPATTVAEGYCGQHWCRSRAGCGAARYRRPALAEPPTRRRTRWQSSKPRGPEAWATTLLVGNCGAAFGSERAFDSGRMRLISPCARYGISVALLVEREGWDEGRDGTRRPPCCPPLPMIA